MPQTCCRQHIDGVLRGFVACLIPSDAADSQQLNAGIVACMCITVSPLHMQVVNVLFARPIVVTSSCTCPLTCHD